MVISSRLIDAHRLKRIIAPVVLAMSLIVGAASSPPVAQAGSEGYYAKKCIMPATVGPGVKGGGCNLYGAPYWVGPAVNPDPAVAKYLEQCAQGMLVDGAFAAGFAVLGIALGPGGTAGVILLGCAANIAQAKVFGS